MGNKDDVPGTFSRGGEERAHVSTCVCVYGREKEKGNVCVCYPLWFCLMDRICHLTSALGQRAKVISLSQPKVSGKARNPSRGTVGPDLWVPVALLCQGTNVDQRGCCVCMLLLPLQLWHLLCHFMFRFFLLLSTATFMVTLCNESVDGCRTGLDFISICLLAWVFVDFTHNGVF